MNPERSARLKEIVLAAASLSEPELGAYLDAACAGDPTLRQDAEALLAERGRAAQAPVPPTAATETAPGRVTAEEMVGPYRLLQRLGEGGMGEVWLAEQTEPIRRKVAIKLIKSGMDTRHFVARFEAERQALALMDHPSIAKVFDGGATERGLPYFVMEYVQGEAITTYCDRHKLTIRERLDAFTQVCEAVQHAHQKGIIHRDLKPSNMLVTIQGERPVPKIIDFGVAKATAQRLTEKTLFTELGVLIGTPEYMSPEQAEMTGIDVDTRTDVYALGVTLYELLTGTLPFSIKEIRNAGFDEIRRRIREEDPPRPSTKVKSQGSASTEAARLRRTEPAKLASRLQGDLDWIAMRALEKDRTRRYGSAADLAQDIRRHLADEPVLAGPPALGYRTRKFVRRHRLAVLAASVIGLVLLLGIIGTTAGLFRARRAEQDARRSAETSDRVVEFLYNMLRDVDPQRMGKLLVRDLGERATGSGADGRFAQELSGLSGTDTARLLLDEEILARAGHSIDKNFQNNPEIAARLRYTLAGIYSDLGMPDKAEDPGRAALEIREQILGHADPATLRSGLQMGWILAQQGRFAEAETLHRSTLETSTRALGAEDPLTLSLTTGLAWVLRAQGKYDEGADLYQRALPLYQRVLGAEDPRTLSVMNDLGYLEASRGRMKEAERLHRQTYEIRLRQLGPEDPDTLWSLFNLAWMAEARGDLVEGARLFEQCLETRRRLLGTEHPDTLVTQYRLGMIRTWQSRYTEAEHLLRPALDSQRRLLGVNHQQTLWTLHAVARLEYWQGRLTESLRDGEEALSHFRTLQGGDHLDTVRTLDLLRQTCWAGGWLDEIRRLDREMLPALRQAAGRASPHWVDLTEVAFALLDDGHSGVETAKEALGFAERAVQMSGTRDSMPLAALALAHFTVGDAPRAVEAQKKAIASLRPLDGWKRSYMESQLARYEAARSR